MHLDFRTPIRDDKHQAINSIHSALQKLLLPCLFIVFCFTYSLSSFATTYTQTLPKTLDQHWQFCPQKDFDAKRDPRTLECSPIQIPGGWEQAKENYDGFGILYTHFSLIEEELAQGLAIAIRRIRDADKIFVNGHQIGETGEFPPNFEKAVLYSRIYPIPQNIISAGQNNLLTIWVYNDARPGGVTQKAPVIDSHVKLLDAFYRTNYRDFAFIIVMSLFSLLHIVYFLFNRQSYENIYYAVFLLGWAAYIFTFSNLALATDYSMNLLFRANVSLFFWIFAFFPMFIFNFFHQPLPLGLKVIITSALAFIPLCFMLAEPHYLYYPLELIEIFSLFVIAYIVGLFYRVIKAKIDYAKPMAVVISLYALLGTLDIFTDFFHQSTIKESWLFGPWAILLLSLLLTVLVVHKNLRYYQDATIDGLTRALRFNEFSKRLEQEILRAERNNKAMVIMMIDLDNFKAINDYAGHLCGDLALKLVSSTIQKELRQFDLLGRYGGDEFCVAAILDQDSQIKTLVDRLHAQINRLSLQYKNQTIRIAATIGATIRRPKDPVEARFFIEQADSRLIAGKQKEKAVTYW